MLKELDLIAQAAAATDCPMPLVASVRATYQAAAAKGFGERDYFVLTSGDAEPTPRA
jgi:3-hydroxyisobutyrate dehydrogenase-like beta-hydroxyacid dehydrogenase